uniref:Anaphase-promoting complex subunit 5 n=1 Tax=Globisporangium ultimum (strain ATCC 200006 / CBS 805.95 / DAOM BR144) TaxID=431595 RepID=K3W628_GLOUD
MRPWVANCYVLSVSILVAEYVRQHQEDARRDAPDAGTEQEEAQSPSRVEQTVISKSSLNALALFLVEEIQHPMKAHEDGSESGMSVTTLGSLLRRLQSYISDPNDFMILSIVLVGILVKIDSPDAVSNVVDRIAECATPLNQSGNAEDRDSSEESASLLLMRKSVLGLFVRKFLLGVNRLLFDGISRLYDEVTRYVEQFQLEEERARENVEHQQQDNENDEAKHEENGDGEESDVFDGESEEENDGENGAMEMDLSTLPQSISVKKADGFLWKDQTNNNLLLSPIPIRLPAANSAVFTPLDDPPSTIASPSKARTSTALLSVSTEPQDSKIWSHDQMNYILTDMMRTVERERTLNGNALDDDPFSAHLRQVTQSDRSNPSVLFVKYLDFLHRRDYQGALDSLHQYHDIALLPRRRNYQSRGADVSGSSNGVAAGSASTLSGDSPGGMHFQGTGIQYAALNLAGLQIMFDHYQAAYESIQEAIRVAQHHGDHVCVAFALSWLIRVYQKLGKSKQEVLGLLESCIERAKELHIRSLQVLADLIQVESNLLKGCASDRYSPSDRTAQHLPHFYVAQTPSPRPLHIWLRLQESVKTINLMSAPTGTNSLGFGGTSRGIGTMNPQLAAQQAMTNSNNINQLEQNGSGMRWMKSVEGVLDSIWKLSGKLSLSSAVGWRLFGHQTLAAVFDRMHFICFQDTATASEIAISVCQMALSQLGDVDLEQSNIYAQGLCFLLDTVDAIGEELIHHVSVQRKLHHLFYLWALRSGQAERAKMHLELLLNLSSAHHDLPAYIEALLARAKLWCDLGEYSKSLELLESLEKTCNEHSFAFLHAQVLIMTCQVLRVASSADAPFSALNSVLRATQVCEQQEYDLLLAEAHIVIAEIYISMGKTKEAYSLVNAQMPLVMEHGDIHLRGECLLVLAKVMLACADAAPPDCAITSEDRVLELLNESFSMFTASLNIKRLREVAYLKALIFNQLSRDPHQATVYIQEKEIAAKEFLTYEKRLEQAKRFEIEPFFEMEFPESIRRVITNRLMGN